LAIYNATLSAEQVTANYNVQSASVSATVPGAPTSVSGTVANGSSVVSWGVPVSNGGSPITGYTVTSTPSVSAPASCTNTSNLSCTFTGLTNGTAYTFSVIAMNAAGNSTAGTAAASVTPVSNVATLSSVTIKGQNPTLGTPNSTLGSQIAGAITLTSVQAASNSLTSIFTKTDAGATISRIVKYDTGTATTNFETDTTFTNGATSTVSNSDFFIIKVIAADGTVRFYRVNVIVNSNVSTLSGATIKGQNATLGTPNSTLGSETAGAITLTTAQANSTSLTSTVTKTNAGATTKIVKYLSGATADIANFDAATDLTSGTTTTFADGDFFFIKVF
jgi:hypothetical protein